jgi:hypothetical protein
VAPALPDVDIPSGDSEQFGNNDGLLIRFCKSKINEVACRREQGLEPHSGGQHGKLCSGSWRLDWRLVVATYRAGAAKSRA